MKVKVAVVIESAGAVVTCGVSGLIDEKLALEKARAKTNGNNIIAECIAEIEVPLNHESLDKDSTG